MQNKQQEFLKHREKLKYVTHNTIVKNSLDPDIMIEQLISDKETFKFNVEPPLPYVVPKWLKVENNLVPAVYEQVWQAVKLGPTFQFCDTKIITHLFTTSGLSLEKLGYLWSLTNVSSPGFLTRQELFIMLALIALVQTGYHVHDISILNGINHPILPQLDYSFLKITVANPTINRSTRNNDMKSPLSIVYNGYNSLPPLNDAAISKQPSKNMNTFMSTPLNVESLKNSQPLNIESLKNDVTVQVELLTNGLPVMLPPNSRKSDMDVSFAIPERKIKDVDFNFAPKSTVSELDVDFPFPPNQMSLKLAPSKPKTNFNNAEPRRDDVNARLRNSSGTIFPSKNSLTSSLEPRSLDLPVFNETPAPAEEDEFTEFQSATVTAIDEYSDFQSASPSVKYEVHSSAAEKVSSLFDSNSKCELPNSVDSKLPLPFDSNINQIHNSVAEKLPSYNSNAFSLSNAQTEEEDFVKDEPLNHATSIDADKYDVFRALMEPNKEEKPQATDCNEDENDEEDEEFGDFYTADVKQNEVKRVLSMKDKCLEACLRLLQEGLHIFSSMSNEQTITEVLSDERGCRYFCQLKIVYDTSQRFQRQFESTHLNDTIHLTWAKLSKYTKYISNDDLLDEIPAEDDVDATPCKLCDTKCDVNCVRYAGHDYHVTCINLFLHFVEDSEITSMLKI